MMPSGVNFHFYFSTHTESGLTCWGTCVQIREGLDWDQAVQELLQAVDYLRSTGSPKVRPPPPPTAAAAAAADNS